MAGCVRALLSALPCRGTSVSPRTNEDRIDLAPDTSPRINEERIDPLPDTSPEIIEERIDPPPDVSPKTEEPKMRLDPAEVKEYFDRIGHFRILVIGRSNAGKTTLLQRVCNTTELPEIFNAKGEKIDPATVQGSLERGHHNIEDELIFQSNPGFIFHDSRGFEAGSVNELHLMKKFVADRAATMELEKRIHVIWYCCSMADHERPILAAEEKFFNECNTGNVPVIAVLTKGDAVKIPALNQYIREKGVTMSEAMPRAEEIAGQMLSRLREKIESQLNVCKYPPKGYLSMDCMNQEGADCGPLLKCTTDALDEAELQKLVISTQQTNFVLNIEYAVKGAFVHIHQSEFNKMQVEKEILGWMPFKRFERFWLLRFRERELFERREEEEERREELFERREEERREEFEERREEFELLEEEERRVQRLLELNQDKMLMHPHTFNIQSDAIPLMCPSLEDSPMHQSIMHATGCILVFEYIYFLLQANEDTKIAFQLAVNEYTNSGTQVTVLNAIQHAIVEHGNSYDHLRDDIIDIILHNRMSKKFLYK